MTAIRDPVEPEKLPLKVLQLNVGGLTSKKAPRVRDLLNDLSPDIILLQETWISDTPLPAGCLRPHYWSRRKHTPSILKATFAPHYSVAHRKDSNILVQRTDGRSAHYRGGVLTAVRTNTPFSKFSLTDLPEEVDAVGITVRKNTHILNLYQSPSSENVIPWGSIVKQCKKGDDNSTVYLCGDLNITTGVRKDTWEFFLENNKDDVLVLNNGSPTYCTANASTSPDVSAVFGSHAPYSSLLHNSVSSWETTESRTGPHRAITFFAYPNSPQNPTPKLARGTQLLPLKGRTLFPAEKLEDYSTACSLLLKLYEPSLTKGSVPSRTRVLSNLLKLAARKTLPRTGAHEKYDGSLSSPLITDAKDLLERAENEGALPDIIIQCKKALATAESLKKASLMLERLQQCTANWPNTSAIFRAAKGGSGLSNNSAQIRCPLKCPTTGRVVWDLSACSNLLADSYVLYTRLTTEEKREQRSLKRKYLIASRERVSSDTNCNWITPSLVEHSIHLLKNGRAPGPDLVEPELLKFASTEITGVLSTILNDAVNHGVIPVEWKTSRVIPILKSGKPENCPKSFRPINLLCVPAKVLERCIMTIINEHVHRIIDERQFGYRPLKGTEEHLATFVSGVYENTENGKSTLAVSLDSSQAFDRIPHNTIRKCLLDAHIPGKIARILMELVTNRRIRVVARRGDLAVLSKLVSLKTGVPQGSVTGPVLYILAANSLFNEISEDVIIVVYADDILLYCHGTDLSAMHSMLQNTLDLIHNWAVKEKLVFNGDKSHACLYGPMASTDIPPLTLNGEIIPQENSLRVLGVTIDHLLHFDSHVDDVINTVKLKSRSLHHIRDAPQKLRIMVRNSLVVTPALYALGIYGPFLKASKKQELQVCLNDTERLATALPMSTRLEVLHLECSTLKLERLISNRSVALLARLTASPFENLQAAARRYRNIPRVAAAISDTGFADMPQLQLSIDPGHNARLTYQWLQLSERIKIQCNRTYTSDEDIMTDAHLFNTLIFTDGSVEQDERISHGRASFAVVVYDSKYNHVRTMSTTMPCLPDSYTAEIAALQKSVTSIVHNDGNVVIYTDSLSTLQALSSPPPKTQDIATLMESILIHDMSTKGTITFRHVKAHNGVKGNEIADAAADWSTTHDRAAPRPADAPFTRQAFMKKVKTNLITQSIDELRTLPSHHKDEPGHNLSRSCQWFLLSTKGKPLIPTPGLYDPRLEKAVVKLRCNASHLLGSFLRRRHLQPHNRCVFCHQPNGDLKHLLRDCVSFSEHRPEKVPMDFLNHPEGYEFAKHIVAAAEKLGLYNPNRTATPTTITSANPAQ